jgi:hypothetical protein
LKTKRNFRQSTEIIIEDHYDENELLEKNNLRRNRADCFQALNGYVKANGQIIVDFGGKFLIWKFKCELKILC